MFIYESLSVDVRAQRLEGGDLPHIYVHYICDIDMYIYIYIYIYNESCLGKGDIRAT